MSEHQTRITTQMVGTFQALDGVAQRMDKIERATRRANTAAKDHQATLTKSLAKGGQAVSKVGGGVGAIGGQFAGAMSMGGGFAAAGIAAAAVGVAYKSLTGIIEQRVQQERLAIEWAGKYRDAMKSAANTVSQQALAGLGQEGAVRKLIGRGGNVDDATRYAKEAGISFEESAEGLAEAHLERDPVKRKRLIDTGILGAKLGGGFGETMSSIRGDRFAKRLLDDGRGEEALARVMSQKTGAKVTLEDIRSGAQAVRGDPFLSETDRANRRSIAIDANERQQVLLGEASSELSRQLAAALSPAIIALMKLQGSADLAADGLRREAKAAGTLSEYKDDIAWAMGSGPGGKGMQAAAQSAAASKGLLQGGAPLSRRE
ncbi:MAG TPA: hypothetical protein VEZ12_15855 [Herpetosiphonaceae bacterium]|nr:hypothetical protein [Herpetosiphonaceae bacterium]